METKHAAFPTSQIHLPSHSSFVHSQEQKNLQQHLSSQGYRE